MHYPDDFNTPAFPAGKRVIVSRMMAIGISIGLMIIVFLAGMILWAATSRKIDPFLISVNPATGTWTLVGHGHMRQHSATYLMQESLVRNFVENWFAVSSNPVANDARWEMCDMATCASDEYRGVMSSRCALSCISSPQLMEKFVYNIVPTYQDYVANGMEQVINMSTLNVAPISGPDTITDAGGTWQISGTILTKAGAKINIMAFATVGRMADQYSKTMGFYIADFNAYKMN